MRKLIYNFLLILASISPASTYAGGLAEVTTIKQLLTSELDGKYIAVSGTVSRIELKIGRLGSHYIEIELISTEIKRNFAVTHRILALSTFKIFTNLGDQLSVVGIYKKEGRFAGFLADNFISVEFAASGDLF